MNRLVQKSILKNQVALYSSSRAAFSVFPGAYLNRNDVTSRVLNVVNETKRVPVSVSLNTTFAGDLGYDSLVRKQLNENLGAEFCVKVPAAASENFITVANVVDFFASHPKAR